MMVKSKGNMYEFVTHTWNAIKGKCSHDCSYCYMKIWGELPPIRLVEKELNSDLGKDNFIFVGSSTDMFATDVPTDWIITTLKKCSEHDNKYLFQSKNVAKMWILKKLLPKNTVVGTTIESNRRYDEMGNAPSISERVKYMKMFKEAGFETMITVEPIMDFDVDVLYNMIVDCNPKWINIGADSKGHGITEPSKEKILELADKLKDITLLKNNLKRLIG